MRIEFQLPNIWFNANNELCKCEFEKYHPEISRYENCMQSEPTLIILLMKQTIYSQNQLTNTIPGGIIIDHFRYYQILFINFIFHLKNKKTT